MPLGSSNDSDDRSRNPGARASGLANSHRLAALGQAIDEKTGVRHKSPRRAFTSRSRRRKLLIRGAIALGVVVVLIVGGVVGDYFYLGSLLKRQHIGHLQSSGSSVNSLLIGSTTRCGLQTQNIAFGLCATTTGG